jgi:hypothetical protein
MGLRCARIGLISVILGAIGACSLLAPSDDELLAAGDAAVTDAADRPDTISPPKVDAAPDGRPDASSPACPKCSSPVEVCVSEADGQRCVAPAAALAKQRWELPCGEYYGNNPPNNSCRLFEPGATSCAPGGRYPVNKELLFGGQSKRRYDVTERFRGVVEPKTYVNGRPDGMFYIGGGEATTSNYNTYSLSVSDPPQNYYLNFGTEADRILVLNYERTIPIMGQSSVTLLAFTRACGALRNCADISKLPECTPLAVPDEPTLAAFDGHVILLDVVRVVESH